MFYGTLSLVTEWRQLLKNSISFFTYYGLEVSGTNISSSCMLTFEEGKKGKKLKRLCSNRQLNSNWSYGGRTQENWVSGCKEKEADTILEPEENKKRTQPEIRPSRNFPSRLLDSLMIFSSHSPLQLILLTYKCSVGCTGCPVLVHHSHRLLSPFLDTPRKLTFWGERFFKLLHTTESVCFCVKALSSSPSFAPDLLCGFAQAPLTLFSGTHL